jgi:Na+-driven multidrug efflux pump
MEVIATIIASWITFVVGAIIYTKKYEKPTTKLAETVRSRHYG